jgi:flagellar biosynthesis/type III secretory pathway protein FliH
MTTERHRHPDGGTRNLRLHRPNLLLREREQALRDAVELREEAEARVEEMLATAQREIAQARRQACEEGRRQGCREVAASVADALTWRRQELERHATGLADLATRMAQRILRQELRLNPERVVDICRGVLMENLPGSSLRLLVNPRDLVILERHPGPLVDHPSVQVVFEASDEVERGGCVVVGELGRVDGRLSIQLGELKRALQGESR